MKKNNLKTKFKYEYILSNLLFYLKGSILADNNFLRINGIDVFLGVVPKGKTEIKIAINQISSVDKVSTKSILRIILGAFSFLLGVIFTLAGFVEPFYSALGILLLLIGYCTFFNGFINVIIINLTSGDANFLSLCFWDRGKLDSIVEDIESLINQRMDDTNTRIHTDKIVNTIKNLKMYDNNADEFDDFDDEFDDFDDEFDDFDDSPIDKKLKRLIDLDELKIKKVQKEDGGFTTKFIFNGIDNSDKTYYSGILKNDKELRKEIINYYKNS